MTLHALLAGWLLIGVIAALLFSPLLERRAAGGRRGADTPAAYTPGQGACPQSGNSRRKCKMMATISEIIIATAFIVVGVAMLLVPFIAAFLFLFVG